MSYILDALRRAESERAREKAPGLHDQPMEPLLHRERHRGETPWLWMLVGAAAVLLTALAWSALPHPSAPAKPVASIQPLPGLHPQPESAHTSRPAHTQPVQPPVPTKKPAPQAAPAPAITPAATAASTQSEDRVPALSDLPGEIQRALPPMRFDGTVYSELAANRLLMLNGQLLREGEPFTSEISVEHIGPKSAVLNYRGQRFELGHP